MRKRPAQGGWQAVRPPGVHEAWGPKTI
jgi:hypothetical protein